MSINHDAPASESTPATTRRAIRRLHAESYMVWTLLSFAVSVSLTRLFLELTGYPQIGNTELHVAHVLWGGLLLFIASILPLIFANRWAFMADAVIAGIGMGLFIDEVGKFITKNNDYFYPPAAPIIYVVFLLTFVVYLFVRRAKGEDIRSEFYYIFEELEEVLDHDLSDDEKLRIHKRIELISKRTDDPVFINLANSLHEFLDSPSLYIKTQKPTLIQRLAQYFTNIERRLLTKNRYRAILVGGLTAWGAWAISYPISVFSSLRGPKEFTNLIFELTSHHLIRGMGSLNLFTTHLSLEGSTGLLILVGAVLLATGKSRKGIFLGSLGLLISLTIIDPLLFYFEQFATILTALVQFILLMLLSRYRKLYMKEIITLEKSTNSVSSP
jgi:hypothetical protein